MASINKDEVDFRKLERDVYNAIESEARYSRENSAKFRAVEQKVATYEEFVDIVKASHLRPLEKKDKMPEKFVQPWNTTVLGRGESEDTFQVTTKVDISKTMKPPANSLALANDWRRLKTDKEKLDYLLFIKSERLKKIFSTEISGGLLGDILKVLLDHENGDAQEVALILEALSSAKRFKLDLQFMTSTEKEICKKLFAKLKDNTSAVRKEESSEISGDTTEGNALTHTGVSEESVLELAALFDVVL